MTTETDDLDLGHVFLVMWCSEGLECVIDVTAHEKRKVWAELKNEKFTESLPIHQMVLRAKVNAQRIYEIYSISAQAGITADDIEGMFNAHPQSAADTIRAKGVKIYSDRQLPGNSKIVIR